MVADGPVLGSQSEPWICTGRTALRTTGIDTAVQTRPPPPLVGDAWAARVVAGEKVATAKDAAAKPPTRTRTDDHHAPIFGSPSFT
jgi:hypothetical protein